MISKTAVSRCALQAGQEGVVYQRMQAIISQYEISHRREQQRQQQQQQRMRQAQEQEARCVPLPEKKIRLLGNSGTGIVLIIT